MGDREIVTLLAAGDPHGLELAYTAYADRIHDYARRTLRSADAAADVTHDTFLIALAKAGDLRDPDKLRPWLYAIARNECLRVLRASARTSNLDPEIELPAEEPEMSTGMSDTDLRVLVHAAAAGLSPKDREVFDLGMRHDLSASEIAAALGVSDNAAHAMLSRVRTQFERTLGAFVVARSGRSECAELSSLLAPWSGEFDALWRKRIARHVSGCAACTATEKRELSPAALLGLMPLFLASPAVRERVFSDDQLELVSMSSELAERAGPFDRDGFPGTTARSRRRGGLLALGLALLLLLAGVGLLRVLVLESGADTAGGEPSPTALDPATETIRVADTATIVLPPLVAATPVLEPAPTTAPSTPLAPTTAPPATTAPAPTSAPPSTAAPPPVVGQLVVRPASLEMLRSETRTITLLARGGPVDWAATAPDTVTLSDHGGHLATGETTQVLVTLGRTSPAQFTIVFQPGGHTVQVTVEG